MTKQITKTIWDKDNVLFESEALAMQIMDDEGFDLIAKYDASPEIEPGVALERGYIYKKYPGTSTDAIVAALIEKFNLPVDQINEDYDLNITDEEVTARVQKTLEKNTLDEIKEKYKLKNLDDNEISNILPEVIKEEMVAGAVADIITEKTIAGFKAGLKAIPGITKALKQIDEQMGGIENRAGCTTSPTERMTVSLECAVDPVTNENAELATLFNNRAYSGYHVSNKYEYFFEDVHPEWDTAECAIVEDSESGVSKAAAIGNGIRIIGTVAADFYENKQEQADILKAAGADIVVSHASDLPAALEWLNNGLTLESKPEFQSQVWTKEDNAVKQDRTPKPAI